MSRTEDAEYGRRVFDLILFIASEEGTSPIPSSETEILLEMAVAVSEYLVGDIKKIPGPNDLILGLDGGWTGWVNQKIEEALQQNSKHLNPALVEALKHLLTIEWRSERDDSYWTSGVKSQLRFRQRGFRGTFYLTVPDALAAREDLTRLDADTVEHCKQIGLLMRKYIARDLAKAKK